MRLHPRGKTGWDGGELEEPVSVRIVKHLTKEFSARIDLEVVKHFQTGLCFQNGGAAAKCYEAAEMNLILGVLVLD